MSDSWIPGRPPTPQVLLHRLPDKPEEEDPSRKPNKYIIIIMGSPAAVGKVQISQTVAKELSTDLWQGDSVHDSSAKAATVGLGAQRGAGGEATAASGPNKERYQRMWLSKMTRTGLLFPEESRAATEGFTGFGGTSSTSSSRRGSVSSVASASSNWGPGSSVAASSRHESVSSPTRPITSTFPQDMTAPGGYNAVFTMSEKERLRRANPAQLVISHPELEPWHKAAIRKAVGDYNLGVIFAPLYEEEEEDDEGTDEDEELPILKPLDPRTMSSFPISFGQPAPVREKSRGWGNLDEEMTVNIDVNANVEDKTSEIVRGVKYIIGLD